MSDHSGKKINSEASGSGEGACESPNNWKEFLYLSDSGRYKYQDPSNKIIYGHWLPSQREELLPKQQEEGELPDFYKEFDTLTHTTTMENAYSIFKNGFKPRPVNDSSVVNPSYGLMKADTGRLITPRPLHPLGSSPVLWYGPSTFNQLQAPEFKVERYGNVLFSMIDLWGNEGIRRDGLHFYFVEVIKYHTFSACRILVTHKDYPELKPYDPYISGGPLYIKRMTPNLYKYYYASEITWHDGTIVPNVLEIMKEESTTKKNILLNHVVSFFECVDPRRNVRRLVVLKGPSEDVKSYLVPNILGVYSSYSLRLITRNSMLNLRKCTKALFRS